MTSKRSSSSPKTGTANGSSPIPNWKTSWSGSAASINSSTRPSWKTRRIFRSQIGRPAGFAVEPAFTVRGHAAPFYFGRCGCYSVCQKFFPILDIHKSPLIPSCHLMGNMIDCLEKNPGGSHGKSYQEHPPPFQGGDSGKDQDNGRILAGAKMVGRLECPG